MAKSPPASASSSAQAAADTPPTSFEAALEELEGIVQTMESGQLPLEKSLAAYERGITLLKYCQTTLDGAERKLQALENGVLRQLADSHDATSRADPL
ncbi:MAG: exodeoxyribonuclease VII small subunit [Sterolibacterium sp.]|nr:exodeoxyribonuclease VII small subunit [Sterolibacterium sp.]